LVQCAVETLVVEMGYVFGQHVFEVVAVEDQYPVERLAAEGADPSLGDRVRPGRLHRCAEDADALAGEHGIKDAGELGVAVPDKNLKLATRSPRSISRFRACWATQAAFGFTVVPRRWTRRVACSTTNRTENR
jgi:hypothetical protein